MKNIIKVGDICHVLDSRGHVDGYYRNEDGESIKVNRVYSSGQLSYDILNAKGKVVGSNSEFQSCDVYPVDKDGEKIVRVAKYLVGWMEEEDPFMLFETEAEAKAFIDGTLINDADVEKDSIELFELGKRWAVKQTTELVEITV